MSNDNTKCAFCGDDRVTERHHIVPRRYDGSDDDENLVTVCPTCHEVLERLYDRRFYQKLGARIDDRDAYEKGVLDTMEVFWDAWINDTPESREWYEAARYEATHDLLHGFGFCTACSHATEDKEECDVCHTTNTDGELIL